MLNSMRILSSRSLRAANPAIKSRKMLLRPFASTAAASTTTSSTRNPLSSLQGLPVAKLVPPGHCQFDDEFQSVELVDRVSVSSTSSVLRFALPDSTQPLQLSTCACILAGATINGEKDTVIRPYTPISTNELVGYMDLLVKHYENGTMSAFLKDIPIGSQDVAFKRISFNVKLQAPFTPRSKEMVLIAGGTGITPMIQALHAILGDEKDEPQKVTLLYGSKTQDDILANDLLQSWTKLYPQLQVVHILSDEKPSDLENDASVSSWTGRHGMIDKRILKEFLPSKDSNTQILVCGPPPMYEALCGSRDDQDSVTGILGDMGYSSQQVYKF